MNIEEERRRGGEAEQLLRHPLLVEALAMIEARLVDQLGHAELTPERIARLQAVLAGKRTFERYLQNVVTSGNLAAMDDVEKRKRGLWDVIRAA